MLLPTPTARLVLGVAPSRGPTLALWQLAGASIATLLVPMALNLKVAQEQGRLSAATHAMESLALAAAAGVHVAAFARDLEHGRGSLIGTPVAIEAPASCHNASVGRDRALVARGAGCCGRPACDACRGAYAADAPRGVEKMTFEVGREGNGGGRK